MRKELQAKKEETIHAILAEYTHFLLGIAVFLLLIVLAFYFFSSRQYQKNTEHVLLMNSFYQELDLCNGFLTQYVRNGTERYYTDLEQSSKKLTAIMGHLQAMELSREFDRDMQDLGWQLQKYQAMIEVIHFQIADNQGKQFNSGLLSAVSENAVKAAHMYDLMVMQFKDIDFDLISAVNGAQQRLNTHFARYCLVLIGLTIILIPLAVAGANTMTAKIILPLQKLVASAEKIRDGQIETFEDVVIEGSSYREVSRLVSVFNRMVHQLRDHIRTINENARTEAVLHEKELENMRITNLLKTSELKALQMQINPHFLFNTLNMIARTADMGNTEQTSVLLWRTARLLRYSLDYSGRTVPLATEIEMLGNYVYLQEQRFGSRIFFDFDLDERFHQTKVPCFILQPLVENAIVHGMKEMMVKNVHQEYVPVVQKNVITVKTTYNPNTRLGEIWIMDQGAGMDEKTRQEILKSLDSDHAQREKIGLANVHMRLKLVFGERYQFRFESRLLKGTEVGILLEEV